MLHGLDSCRPLAVGRDTDMRKVLSHDDETYPEHKAALSIGRSQVRVRLRSLLLINFHDGIASSHRLKPLTLIIRLRGVFF